MPVTKILAANGPVPAPLPIGFSVLAAPALRGRPSALFRCTLDACLLVFALPHVTLLDVNLQQKKKKPRRLDGAFFFFYSKFRISVRENKPAKYLCCFWRVSHAKSMVITSDFPRAS
jgi:hypothetical protein